MGAYTKYKFDLNMANPCNFTYKRATGQKGVSTAVYTPEQIAWYASYIEAMVTSLPDDKRNTMVTIYGADLLKELSTISSFMAQSHHYVNTFFLSVAPFNIQPYTESITKLRGIYYDKIKIDLECESPDALLGGLSYDSTEYNIRWLYGRGIGGYVKVAVASVQEVLSVFDIFTRLVDVVPHIKFEIMLDYVRDIDATCEQALVERLSAIKNIAEDNFVYSPPQGVRKGQLPNAMFGNIMGVMTDGGVIYPGYDISVVTDEAVKALAIGTTNDSVDHVIRNRNTLLNTGRSYFDPANLDNLYRGTSQDGSGGVAYNMVPTESAKQLHSLLSMYLSTRGV